MISPMVPISLYGPSPLLSQVTGLLQEAGVMHVEPPTAGTRLGFRPGDPNGLSAAQQNENEALLDRLKKILLLLPPSRNVEDTAVCVKTLDPDSPEATAVLAGLLAEAESIHRRLKESREELSLLRKYDQVIRTLSPILEGIPSSQHLDIVGVTFDRSGGDVIALVRQALARLTGETVRCSTKTLTRKRLRR